LLLPMGAAVYRDQRVEFSSRDELPGICKTRCC
jgi:hypothetical protein